MGMHSSPSPLYSVNVGIDLDETMNDLIFQILKKYNAAYNDDVQYDEITAYNISPFLKPECKHLFKEFCSVEFVESLTYSDEDIEAVNDLHAMTNAYFVTAASPYVLLGHHNALQKHFPWYDGSQLVACHNKKLIRLDYLIDDYEENFAGLTGGALLVSKPWNQNVNVVDKTRWYHAKFQQPLRVKSVAQAAQCILTCERLAHIDPVTF